MDRIINILSSLSLAGEKTKEIENAIMNNVSFLRMVAAQLESENRLDDAIFICNKIIEFFPKDFDTLLQSSRLLFQQEKLQESLPRLIKLHESGFDSPEFSLQVRQQVAKVAQSHAELLQKKELSAAIQLMDYALKLYPSLLPLHEARLQAQKMLSVQNHLIAEFHEKAYFEDLHLICAEYEANKQFEREIECRMEVLRHPLDKTRHSALRINNIVTVIGRILGLDEIHFEEKRLKYVEEAVKTGLSIEFSEVSDPDNNPVRFYDYFCRLQLENVNVREIFGPPSTLPPLPLVFAGTDGHPLSMEQIQARSQALQSRVAYFTGSSPEFLERYGRVYAQSLLKNSDCPALVFICVCAPTERLPELARSVGMDDTRLIFCSDNFNPADWPHTRVIRPSKPPVPFPRGSYYASAPLMHADHILSNLKIPVITSGIDTMLRKGVVEMLDRLAGADVGLNRYGSEAAMGTQVINNMVYLAPTQNALNFVQYLKASLGPKSCKADSPFAMDQMELQLAKHHMVYNNKDAIVKFFDEHDINNIMFNQTNIAHHMHEFRKFRFVNIFAGGCDDKALTEQDVYSEIE